MDNLAQGKNSCTAFHVFYFQTSSGFQLVISRIDVLVAIIRKDLPTPYREALLLLGIMRAIRGQRSSGPVPSRGQNSRISLAPYHVVSSSGQDVNGSISTSSGSSDPPPPPSSDMQVDGVAASGGAIANPFDYQFCGGSGNTAGGRGRSSIEIQPLQPAVPGPTGDGQGILVARAAGIDTPGQVAVSGTGRGGCPVGLQPGQPGYATSPEFSSQQYSYAQADNRTANLYQQLNVGIVNNDL